MPLPGVAPLHPGYIRGDYAQLVASTTAAIATARMAIDAVRAVTAQAHQ